MREITTLLCTAAVAAWLTGCANTTSIETRYQQPQQQAINSLLVAARTPDANYADKWEKACRPMLNDSVATLSTSSQAGIDWDGNQLSPLVQWADEHQIGAVLIVDITRILIAQPMIPGHSDPSDNLYYVAPGEDNIGIPTYSLFLGKSAKKPPKPPIYHQVEAQLIDNNGKMLWDGMLTTHEANSLSAIGKSQCRALARALAAKYLPKSDD